MNGARAQGPEPRAREDTPVELNAKLPAPSSHQRPTSQPDVADRAFTTHYATQRTTAVYDHMEREEPAA